MNALNATSTALDTREVHEASATDVTELGTRDSWAYPNEVDSRRDLRIDFLRGLAILFVVVDHINLYSAYHVISHERIGVVSGAELFVLLSGLVLGIVHRRRAVIEGWRASANRMWARARLLYLTSLAVILSSYVLSQLPFLDSDILTTWTDETTGTVYSLYGTTPLLADYPVPPPAVLDIIFLNVGPYPFNVIGLYVVLLAIAPFAMRLLLSGRWWILLLGSWAIYGANEFLHWQVFPSSFENQFPLLSWQLLFFMGLLTGFYWDQVRRWFDRPAGRVVVLIAWAVFAVMLFFTWNNPAKANDPWALRLDIISDATFWSLYEDWFRRDFLGLLRVVNVVAFLIVSFAVLTRLWVPLNCLFGWLLVPLGGATLYVFIMHLVFALIAASLPVLDDASLWINTLAHTVILLSLWLMVRNRMLFRWVPR